MNKLQRWLKVVGGLNSLFHTEYKNIKSTPGHAVTLTFNDDFQS